MRREGCSVRQPKGQLSSSRFLRCIRGQYCICGKQDGTYSSHDQDHHQRSLRNSRDCPSLVPQQKEKGTQRDLLNVQPDKDVRDSAGEKETAGVFPWRLVVHPNEEVLEDGAGNDEKGGPKSGNDGRYDHVGEHCESAKTPWPSSLTTASGKKAH